MAIRGIFQGLQAEILEASHGQEAIESIEKNGPPSAILLDWNMPVMDGIECLQALRANPSWKQIPVVMVTTNNEFTQISTAMAAGANEYVMKPFDKEMIVSKLASIGVVIESKSPA